MLYRRVEFRPSTRDVIIARRRRFSCAEGALSTEGGVCLRVINGRFLVVITFNAVGQRRRRLTVLSFLYDSSCLHRFAEGYALYLNRAILCISDNRI